MELTLDRQSFNIGRVYKYGNYNKNVDEAPLGARKCTRFCP